MVNEAGTTALALLLLSRTFRPPAGDGLLTVTVPVALVPPLTVVGFTVRLNRLGALICNPDEADEDPTLPLIVAVVSVVTGAVATANNADFEPLETVTDDGTTAFLFDDFRETTMPPLPAVEESVTVPVEPVPPKTVEGDRLTLLTT